MPVYCYKAISAGCPHCRGGFEQMQTMKDAPLTHCPQCGRPVRKIPAPVSGGAPVLSNARLRDHGFTKLVNKGGGAFEKET